MAGDLLNHDPSLLLTDLTINEAAYFGKLDVMKYLLQNGHQLEREDDNGKTPLLCVIASDSSSEEGQDRLESILRSKIPPGVQLLALEDVDERTPLLHAIGWDSLRPDEAERLECVEILLEIRANVQHRDHDGLNALHYAVRNGYRSIIRRLLTVRPSLCLMQDGTPILTLPEAALYGIAESISILLRSGAQLEAEDCWGRTALLCAIGSFSDGSEEKNRLSCVRILIEAGANIRHYDKNGLNALHYATREGCLSIVQERFAVYGTLCHVEDRWRRTPLIYACEWRASFSDEEKRLECVKRLVEAGSNVLHCGGWHGLNARQHAHRRGYTSIVQYLDNRH